MSELTELQAALPNQTVAVNPKGGYVFTPSLTEQEWLIAEKIINPAAHKISSARASARSVPNWSTWTQADWTEFFNTNLANGNVTSITNLAEAKAMLTKQNLVINALAKMFIALRDYTRIVE